MKSRQILAASILAADFSRLGEEIREAEAGGIDWIHVDVMDGHFVPNLTMGPHVVEACRRVTDLPLDVHLMIEKPENLLANFAIAGATRLTVHVETCPHLHHTLNSIKDLGISAGVTLNPGTPLTFIKEVMDEVDLILIMTVNPGFGGQQLIKKTLQKVMAARKLQTLHPRDPAYIEVDGGIDPLTIKDTVHAGADVFVAGTAIFQHPLGARSGVQALREALKSGSVKE
ncbi:MAG: ribulose-phosphate 3-epimerase [Chloroflexi bacterium RBG_16_48_8]|nr:MAG: ribulose-phosphate 3-epimerase [Chloroflexi bacterium RBG_16_48_8]